jgi:hypothetical protein
MEKRGPTRAVFTIAMGKQIYIDMAAALTRSFKLWHRDNEIEFFLATDRTPAQLPKDLAKINLIHLEPGQFGTGFTPKLYLDRIAPADLSLFVDADCLCVGHLGKAFARFSGHAVSVVGRVVNDGEWFGDVASICRTFDIPRMPRFNGGIYYLERGPLCQSVYNTARSLLPKYDDIGFRRLRGQPNDEVILSIAMALHGQTPVPERGDIMNSLLAAPGGIKIDVFKGNALLRNPKDHSQHNQWYELEELRPKLVHFLGSELNQYPYDREIARLRLVCARKWPIWLATAWTSLCISLPHYVAVQAKKLLRPLYHAAFGSRRVRISSRI